MTIDTILKAAKNSMINGNHAAHCYSAHVLGKGYVNRGEHMHDRADYLRQLAHSVQGEIDNMGFAVDYAEPGRDKPKRGILFANWNCFPRGFDTILEKAGYAVEWSDEWCTCPECGKAFRLSADSFIWEPAFKAVRGNVLCLDCAKSAE